MTAPVSHEGTGFDSDDDMMQAYADESPATGSKAAPVARVTEVVGQAVATFPPGGPMVTVIDAGYGATPVDLHALLPVEAYPCHGRRGRFVVWVEFTPELLRLRRPLRNRRLLLRLVRPLGLHPLQLLRREVPQVQREPQAGLRRWLGPASRRRDLVGHDAR